MRKLSHRQKEFVKAYIQMNGNQTQAAIKAYPDATKLTATVIGSNNIRKDNVRSAIETALAKHNITVDTVVKPISDALLANKVNTVNSELQETDVPDHAIRLTASKQGQQLLGLNRGDNPSIQFNQYVANQKNNYQL